MNNLNTEYMNLLINQYQESIAKNIIDRTSYSFKIDFSDWLIERMKLSDDYLAVLDYLDLPFEGEGYAEIGKGEFDSVVVDKRDTEIITPFTRGFDKVNNTVLEGRIKIWAGIPYLISTNGNLLNLIYLDSKSYSTVMTQNPYSKENIKNWEDIHNNNELDIIVGMYGFINDKDRKEKILHLKELRDKLDDDSYKMEYTTIGDGYFAAIGSQRQIKSIGEKVLRR